MTRSSASDPDARLAHRVQVLAQDTSYDWLRPRQRRRTLVLIQSMVIVGLGVNALVRQSSLRQALIGVTLTVLGFIGAIFLRAAMRGIADFPDAAVDERIITTRNAGYLNAYRLLAGGTSLVLMTLVFVGSARKQMVSIDTITNLMLCFFVGSMSLPSAVLAWTETDA
jgi:hypothetical protein